MDNKEQRRIAIATKRLTQLNLSKSFDAAFPKSRPNPKQLAVLQDIDKIQYRYVVAGNQSGKSQLAARDLTWMLNNEHPWFERPEQWGSESLTILIAVQDLTLGSEMWYKKVKPFLKDEWREERQGNSLKKCSNRVTGDTIYFVSHSDGSEKNRKHMQGYVAHYVWLDEMPSTHKILEELQRRVDAREGRFLATFTPKFKNDTIRRIIDASQAPVARKYQMSKLDNPIYAERLEEELQKLAGYPESERRTILYGEWSTGESAVYHFVYDDMTVPSLPDHYTKAWRHVVAVDPALRSKCGYTLWAEDPNSHVWYLIDDTYVEGSITLDPETLFLTVRSRYQAYNVVRKITDSMPFFQATATKHGETYMTPYNKNDYRKKELIKGLQTMLSSNRIKIGRWCTHFLDEIQSCQFREDSDKLINSSSYHTLDCAQYFCDAIPTPLDKMDYTQPWEVKLRLENDQYKKKAEPKTATQQRIRPIKGWGRRRFTAR